MSRKVVKDRSESLAATALADEMERPDGTMPEEDAAGNDQDSRAVDPGRPLADDDQEDGYDSESERLFSNHLLHVVSALGGRDVVEEKYVPGDEALDCIRDLKRFLRMDEEENKEDKPAQVLLAKWNILSSDLLPLLLVSVEKGNWKLAISTCEVLVPLTWPVTDPTKIRDMDRVRSYKSAFLKPGVWSAVIQVILHLSSNPYSRRSESDHARLQLIISLIRNVLAINDFHDASVNTSTQAYASATCQEELVARMIKEDVIELLLSLAASTNEFEYRAWNTLLLEIFHYIFQYRTVSDMQIPNVEKQKSALQEMMATEALKRKTAPTRHSRFGGTFTIKTVNGQINVRGVDKFKTVGSSGVSVQKAFDNVKKAKPNGRNKPMDIFTERLLVLGSSKSVFRQVAIGFLENGFTNLLTSVKKDFDVDRKGLLEDNYLHFFTVYSFFLEFHLAMHQGEDDLDNVTGMISHSMTVFILRRMSIYREEKNYKALYYTTRSLQFYLGVLQRMDKCIDEGMRAASLAVQSQFFYESAHISCVLNLARDAKPRYWRFLVSVADCIYTMGQLMKSNFGENGVATARKQMGGDESDEEEVIRHERIYTIDSFYKQCAYESVIDTYCYLIQNFEHLTESTVVHIAHLFDIINRTDSGCNLAPLFYTASTFHTFHTFLTSPVARSAKFEPLKNVVGFICAEAMTRVVENPYIVIDFLFSKTRADCNRLLGNEDDFGISHIHVEEEDPEDKMTEEDLIKEFSLPNEDPGLRGEQIRKLCKWLTRSSVDNADCVRWLASAMRIVLYEDFDDMFDEEEQVDPSTVFLSQFIYMPTAPFFVNEFLSSVPAKLLLTLLDFIPVPSEDTYRFPANLDIDMIEHVEMAKLFAKRYIPPAKKGRKSKVAEANPNADSQNGVSSSSASSSNSSNDDEGGEEGGERIKKKKRKSKKKSRSEHSRPPKDGSVKKSKKEKEDLRIKSAMFVVDSSDDADDDAFFKAEAALREKRDLMARQGILSNSAGPSLKEPSKPSSNITRKKKKKSGDKKKSKRDHHIESSDGLDKEQETVLQESDDANDTQEDSFISSQQKRINDIMGEGDLSSEEDARAIEVDEDAKRPAKKSQPQKRMQAIMDDEEDENSDLSLQNEEQENSTALTNSIVSTTAAGKVEAMERKVVSKSAGPPGSPAVAPVKKRARVIMDSDSD